jgi:hypothetical protein
VAKRKIPMFIQVGDSDAFFPLKVVRATRDVLNENGFAVELTEIPNTIIGTMTWRRKLI